jgi:hypothetical protein
MSSRTRPGSTLGQDLDADRLRYRHRRILSVIAVLRARAADCSQGGVVPEPLLHAIRDFDTERLRVEQRLRDC